MTDRHARLIALAMFSTATACLATFCFALAYRMFFGPGATSLSRVVGGLVLAIDGAAVIMNALTYRMHCPGRGTGIRPLPETTVVAALTVKRTRV
jgi:hypothetical protein